MTDLTLIGPLFIHKKLKLLRLKPCPAKANLARRAPFIFLHFFNVTYKSGRDERVPLSTFLALCDFFPKFFKRLKRPFRVFDNFATESMLIDPKGSPLLHFSALWDIYQKKKNQKVQVLFQKNVLRFLSLRYSADFIRSRLVCSFSINLYELKCICSPRGAVAGHF